MSGVLLAVAILATWRITHLVSAEDGPWDMVVRLRRRAGDGVLGRMMDCFYCSSVWVALPFAWWLGDDWINRSVVWPAVSGGAILLERALPDRKSDLADE
jgi:hypothetical protein